MADEEFPPHPLVAGLAKGLKKESDDGALTGAAQEFDQAQQAQRRQELGDDGATAQADIDAAAVVLANEIANDPNLPEIHTFAGFLGGTLADSGPTQSSWRLLYLDPKLRTWLLVDQKNILLRQEVRDETSPFGSRDHVWMKSDASVSQGEGAPRRNEVQARFLRGDFVSAGDFAASVTGGTFAPPTGPLCPLTPGCCGKKTK